MAYGWNGYKDICINYDEVEFKITGTSTSANEHWDCGGHIINMVAHLSHELVDIALDSWVPII